MKTMMLDEESGDEDEGEDFNISLVSSCEPTTSVKGGSHEGIDPENRSQESQTQAQEDIHLVPRPLPTVKLCGDNIDWTVCRSHVRFDHQTQSIHYFYCYAVKVRIDLSSLSDNPPIDQPMSTEVINKIFLSAHECIICDMILQSYLLVCYVLT